ncbi:hypothetical protein BDU57DRAFT_521296 [Ampelomyces quisqualis]|uniref:Uncharacterized protein n=1 Tax=Ampelomyces quisqualis TaxID=50730 RepID=A0A6A5QBL5_AMPQU|nr:hypothetical protein BDU57DRAFT_521296 [Ampelomyces quisqualis]
MNQISLITLLYVLFLAIPLLYYAIYLIWIGEVPRKIRRIWKELCILFWRTLEWLMQPIYFRGTFKNRIKCAT